MDEAIKTMFKSPLSVSRHKSRRAGLEKKVSFSDRASARPHMSRAEYTEEESVVTWFSREELEDIDDTCGRIANMMHSSGPAALTEVLETRGLENKTSEAVVKRRESRTQVTAAVFHKQFTKAKAGKIAKSASKQSAKAVEEAISRAKEDAQEARKICFPEGENIPQNRNAHSFTTVAA